MQKHDIKKICFFNQIYIILVTANIIENDFLNLSNGRTILHYYQ